MAGSDDDGAIGQKYCNCDYDDIFAMASLQHRQLRCRPLLVRQCTSISISRLSSALSSSAHVASSSYVFGKHLSMSSSYVF